MDQIKLNDEISWLFSLSEDEEPTLKATGTVKKLIEDMVIAFCPKDELFHTFHKSLIIKEQ